MLTAYGFLLVVWIVSFIIFAFAIALKSKGASVDALQALLGVGSLAICLLSLIGLILSVKQEKFTEVSMTK